MSSPGASLLKKLDNRSASIRDVTSRMDHLLLNPAAATYREMVNVTAYSVRENTTREAMGRMVREARRTGRIGSRDFQEKWKAAIFREWHVTLRSQDSEAALEGLYAFFHPNVGSMSFLRVNPYVMVEPVMGPGTSAAFSGPRSSGKTDSLCLWYQLMDRFKQDHLDNGASSQLAIMRNVGAGRRRDPTAAEVERILKDEASVGTKNLTEEVHKRWRERLGLLEAKGVRFVTNIAVKPKSPMIDRIQQAEAVSETWIMFGRNDMNDLMSCHGLDEAQTSDDSQRSMTFGSFVIRTFMSQGGKRNVTTWVATQSEKRLRDQVLEEADMRVIKEPAKPGFKPHVGWITIKGQYERQRFTQIPKSVIEFETKENAMFLPDIDLVRVWAATAALRRRTIEGGDEWTHGDSIRADEDYIRKNRLSEADLKANKNPYLRAEIRDAISNTVTLDMLQKLTVRDISEMLASRHSNVPDGARKFEEELKDWFIPMQAEMKKFRQDGTLPKEATDPDAAADAIGN